MVQNQTPVRSPLKDLESMALRPKLTVGPQLSVRDSSVSNVVMSESKGR